jgi:myo-inositol-1(or 4)-monophosphatase
MKPGESPVTEADFAVDAFLRETLKAARPDYGWLSEETADNRERLSAKRIFVVDPIDGTRDFIAGGDHWCVSIAVVEASRPMVGVLQCPARDLRYWAQADLGAFLDGQKLAAPPTQGEARIAGPGPVVRQFAEQWPPGVTRVAYAPSLAYRVARIASGQLDATFIKPNAHDWDLAAAQLILEQAGGVILDANGASPAYAGEVTSHGALVAGSGALVRAMQSQLANAATN